LGRPGSFHLLIRPGPRDDPQILVNLTGTTRQ
jgi:hypothetical protein